MNYLSAPSIVYLPQIWPVWAIWRSTSSPHFTHNNLIVQPLTRESSTGGSVQSHAGMGVWEVSPLLKIVKVSISFQMPRFSVSASNSLKHRVKDVTSDGLNIQRPAANIKLDVSVHIFYNIPDAGDRDWNVLQSKSSLQLYLCVNTHAQVLLQLGDNWETVWSTAGNTYYHYL